MTGEQFGPYRIEELVGRGGFGAVHRAFDTQHSRLVALKRLHGVQPDERAKDRFLREAQVMARLNEPHIIPVYQYGEIDGQLYLAMPLVSGTDLGTVLQHGALSPSRATTIVSQVAAALDTAHGAGLVHRDIKPSNVLLHQPTSEDGEEFAYLIDFGIAASLHDPGLTGTGKIIGSAAYMAPERFGGGGPADKRADVYALGCMLFEMLTGRPPFVGEDMPSLMRMHLDAPPPRLPYLTEGSVEAMNAVLARALAKDPDARFQSAGALAAATRAALRGGTRPTWPPTYVDPPAEAPTEVHPAWSGAPAPQPAPPGRRRALVGWSVGAVLLALVGVAVVVALVHRGGTVSAAAGSLSAAPTGPHGPRLVATVPVGTGAWAVAVAPDGRHAYVTDTGTDTTPGNGLSVIDTTTNTVTATVTVGAGPTDVVVAPDGKTVYVANYGTSSSVADTVSVIDTGSNAVVATITVGTAPQGIAISPDGSHVYTANRVSNTVSVIDTTTRTVVDTVPAGNGPIDVALSPDGRHAYVPDHADGANTVTVIDTASATVAATVKVGTMPYCVAVSPDGAHVYVTNFGSNTVSVIDTATNAVTATVGVSTNPYDILVDPDGRHAYLTNNGGDDTPSSTVKVLDLGTNTVTGSITAGSGAWGLAAAPGGGRIYVANNGTNPSPGTTVSVIDTG